MTTYLKKDPESSAESSNRPRNKDQQQDPDDTEEKVATESHDCFFRSQQLEFCSQQMNAKFFIGALVIRCAWRARYLTENDGASLPSVRWRVQFKYLLRWIGTVMEATIGNAYSRTRSLKA